MSWSGRDERCEDLFFVDPTIPGNPTEEGQVRIYDSDIVAYIDGAVKSLTEENTGQNVGTGVGVFRDKTGVVLNFKSLLAQGSAITISDLNDTVQISSSAIASAAHRTLYHLIHFIDQGPADGFVSGAFKETLPQGNPFPTSITWWTDSGKTTKIVEKTITRSGGGATNVTPTPITWTMYDADGNAVARVIDDITYSGIVEYQRTRTIKLLSFTNNDTVGVSDGFTIELNP